MGVNQVCLPLVWYVSLLSFFLAWAGVRKTVEYRAAQLQ